MYSIYLEELFRDTLRGDMLDDNIENNWVNICRVPRKDRISEDVKR